MTLDELKAVLDTFSPAKVAFVTKVVESLSKPAQAEIRSSGTWLTEQPDWIEYFGLALSVHHAATTVPLGLTSFETVFGNACEHIGWSIEPAPSATQRFVDMIVQSGTNTRQLSLKSTAAKAMSKSAVHISKLTEAAWIQDARTAKARRDQTLSLFRDYQATVSEIMMLRAFRSAPSEIPGLYQLIEIPVTIFDSIQAAPLDAFSSDAPLLECVADGESVAKVAIDRSDAKVTVRSIQLSACTIHAEWTRRVRSQVQH